MALTFFWRCEGTALSNIGTDDYSAYGATTFTANGSPAINNTQARVGTNSLDLTDTYCEYAFPSAASLAGIFSATEGSLGFWLRVATAGTGTDVFGVVGTDTGDKLRLVVNAPTGSGDLELTFVYASTASGENDISTTALDGSINTWYFVVARWKSSGNTIEVYSTSNLATPITTVTSGSWTMPTNLTSTAGFKSYDGDCGVYIDNIFVADSYSEALQSKATITAYSQYASSSAIINKLAGPFGGPFRKLV